MSRGIPVLPVSEDLGRIPPVVHQIWVGTKPPAWVEPLWERWDSFCTGQALEHRLWTDSNTEHTVSARLRDRYGLTPVQMSDFLRLEVLCMQGGVYMDSDTYPLSGFEQYVGDRDGWFAHGQDWTSKGEPTVSNAMMGMPKGHPFLSDLFQHGVRALERGVKKTFDIVGPAAIRRQLDKANPTIELTVASPTHFPAYRAPDKRIEEQLGRQMTEEELRARFPGALVVHRSAVSWVQK